MRPPPARTAWQWAEAERTLPPGSSEPGRWRQSRFPFWTRIFDAAHDPRTREINVVTGSQMSKTESILNIALARMDDGPRVPILIYEPSQRLARNVAGRLEAALESTSRLRELVARGRRYKVGEKYIAGVRLGVHWSGSKVELSSHAAAIVMLDEVDRMAADVAGEGDPVTLASARLKSYRRSLLLLTTTPTTEGVSIAEARWSEGSRECYEWQCPGCRGYFFPRSTLVTWPDGATPAEAVATGGLACPHCKRLVLEAERWEHCVLPGRWWTYRWTPQGELVPQGPPPDSAPHRSFWATGCSSPWANLDEMIRKLCAATRSGDPYRLQAELNTTWGEWFRGSGERPEAARVFKHIGQHRRGTPPDWTQGLTLGVDVQGDRLEWHLLAIGPGFRRASVDWGQIIGPPEDPATWAALASFHARTWGRWRVSRVLVDSGYQPGYDTYRRPQHVVYQWTRATGGWAYPSKGIPGSQPMPVRQSKADVGGGSVLWLIAVDYWKALLYSNLRSDEQHIQFPEDVTQDLADQITSEELVRLPTGRLVWRVLRGRVNHQLDALILAMAAAQSMNWQLTTAAVPTPRTRIRVDERLRR